MKITLEQRGGYAGVAMKRQVDTAALPPEEATQVQSMVDSVLFTVEDAGLMPRRAGFDMQSFTMTIEDGEHKRTLRLQEGTMPPTIRPLVTWMQKLRPQAG